ncbi:hypothetical protein HN803_00895 [candidate division WWE3 bacterium]|jgi:formate hydrogenlyase subunit 3/multisubunit Na+/H+ antiporter MnhD subunit|nr:hypothetical protein [candidate division WWE3 bacterium]MBT7349335.1 hypothetical protein [candidate division WWE3 bacterium]
MIEMMGWIGLTLLLVAYFLEATNKLPDGSKQYFLLNLIGSISISLHAYYIGSMPILILNIVWALVSAYELIKH